ncbi:MAG: hypothetical protein E7066_10085 [Lentimicrobiaceae bacterium]|nr:hypothetical protein [Lentimicrobiaceae bacterium]
MDKEGKKTGGRQKGTPNKTTGTLRMAISKIVNDYYNSDTLMEDINKLKPKERVDMMEKLAAYVVPKLQSVDLNAEVKTEHTIEDMLIELAEDDE